MESSEVVVREEDFLPWRVVRWLLERKRLITMESGEFTVKTGGDWLPWRAVRLLLKRRTLVTLESSEVVVREEETHYHGER